MSDARSRSKEHFTESEVARILEIACELQHDASAGERAAGLSLKELEDIAREAGLDSALVRRAAADVRAGQTSGPATDAPRGMTIPAAKLESAGNARARFFGGPHVVRCEETVDGELSLLDHPALAEKIGEVLKCRGTTTTLGRGLRWTFIPPIEYSELNVRMITAEVLAKDGRTTIRVEEDMRQLRRGIFLMTLATSLYGCLHFYVMVDGYGHSMQPWAGTGAAAALTTALYLCARTVFGYTARARAKRLNAGTSTLAAYVADTIGGARVADARSVDAVTSVGRAATPAL